MTQRRSRYERPRQPIAWLALLIGILLGGAGGIVFAWTVAPTEEFDTEPWQLTRAGKADYIVAIALAYSYDGDLARTVENLVALRPPVENLFEYVALTACDLARTGYVNSSSGLNALRAMMTLYQLQGQTGCADSLIPALEQAPTNAQIVLASTPTLLPPPSKTPMPALDTVASATPLVLVVATQIPQSAFRLVLIEPFCDADLPGIIEVSVTDFDNAPIPGQPIRVRWDDGESVFYNGLKPERGLAYADFAMEAGKGYLIDMPGLADPATTQMIASPCVDATGRESLQAYRVVFRPSLE
ncbi:MAG: hypothetical protein H7Y11_04390 [Armatimonadetes bacterium]|nr:hypothetical protein [Anaerolineae bacterium]